MEFYLDSADVKTIQKYVKNFNVKGVTCNPTIIIKDGGSIKELVENVPKDVELYLQVLAQDHEGIMEETKQLMSLSPNIIVKIPATPEGLIAIRKLKEEGIDTLATAIYSVNQALMAANCGAAYVAPYVNRMNNLEIDGIQATLDIKKVFDEQKIDCKIIAASFKNTAQVQKLIVNGIEAVTIGADLFERVICNNESVQAAKDFADAWENAYGSLELLI
ncbi:MAG: transaldolase family protein [Lachnospiraceae bacterium]|nr:transaldolase family protein [Lachnospiraceae bacterium]